VGRNEREAICREIVEMMFDAMTEEKRTAYKNACARNCYLTSHYGMSSYNLTTYKEGWHFVCDGCRTHYSAWAYDNDGELIIGRKPNEEKLNMIWSHTFSDNPIDLKKI